VHLYAYMKYRLSAIPTGSAGTDATVKEIARLVQHDLHRPKIRLLATKILANRSVPSKHTLSEAKAIFDYIVRRVRYQKDPIGIETVQSPMVTNSIRAGDCDDHSGFVAGLASAVGIPVRFRVIGYAPDNVVHIYAEMFVNGSWMAADTTEPQHGFGWRPKGLPYEKIYNLNGEVDNMIGSNGSSVMTQGDFRKTLHQAVTQHLQSYWERGLINLSDVRGYLRVIAEGNFPSRQSLLVEPTQEAIQDFENHIVRNQIGSVKPAGVNDGMGELDGFLSSVWGAVKKVGKAVLGGGGETKVVVQPAAPAQIIERAAAPAPTFWSGNTPMYLAIGGLAALLILPKMLK